MYSLLENKKVILLNGRIAYKVDQKIRIVEGRLTNHYDSDIKELTPVLISKIRKLIPDVKIVKYKKSYYVIQLIPIESKLFFLSNKVKEIAINEKLNDRFYFEQPDDIRKSLLLASKNLKTEIDNQDDIADLSEITELTDDEILNFIDLLSKFPCFAIESNVGKKIFDLLKSNIDSIKVRVEKKQIFYRSRKWKEDKPWKSSNDLWLAIEGKNMQGRFNPVGVPYLYICDNSEILRKELRLGEYEKRSTIKIINKDCFFVFDLTQEDHFLFKNCLLRNDGSEKNTKKYSIPNFIAQCLHYLQEKEKIQIDGIKYFSVQDENKTCINYVLFSKNQNDFEVLDFISEDN